MTSVLSVATHTAAAPLFAACSATRTTIGFPAISASVFPGRRVEAKRAGIRTINGIGITGKSGVDFFVGFELACLDLKHHWNSIAHRERKAVRATYQFLFQPAINQRSLAG